jgi:dihydrofolate reductase
MRRVIVSQFVSLDGVMEDPGGSEDFDRGGWAFQFDRGAEGNQFKLDEVMQSDALLLGRVTYLGFAAAWPSREGEFADKFNAMPKFVVSTTLATADWNNSTLIKGDVAEAVTSLKQQPGGDIMVNGSAQLAQTLMEHDLVDAYRLMVFPLVLGRGKRLFHETRQPTALKLIEARPVGSDGVVVLVYEPARNQ